MEEVRRLWYGGREFIFIVLLCSCFYWILNFICCMCVWCVRVYCKVARILAWFVSMNRGKLKKSFDSDVDCELDVRLYCIANKKRERREQLIERCLFD